MAKRGTRHKKVHKKSGLVIQKELKILFGAIFLIILLLIGLQIYRNVTAPLVAWQPTPTVPLSPTSPIPTSALPKLIEKVEFEKRQYDSSTLFLDDTEPKIKYPVELTNFRDSDLTSLSCTETYGDWGSNNQFSTNTPTGRDEYSLSNEKLENYIKILSQKVTPEKITWINSCTTEDGKTFVFYAETGHGAGNWSGPTQLGIDNGNGINTTIKNLGEGCSALQLVKNDYLYIRCATGEGGGAVYSISQVNLNNSSVTRLLYCLREGNKASCK